LDGLTGDPPAAPDAADAAGERRPHAPVAAEPRMAAPTGPRTKQELAASNGPAPFEAFLAGPWYRRIESDGDGAPAAPVEIVLFEPEQRHITLFDGEVQEIYSWDNSNLRSATRLAIQMHNTLVTSVEKTVVIEVTADNEFDLTVSSSESDGDSDRNGIYLRLGDTAGRELAQPSNAQPGMSHLQLNGQYHGSDGQTIVFDSPRFTWQQHNRRLTGGFAVYSVGQPVQSVIVFKAVSSAGATDHISTYALEFREHRGGERVRRSLVLHPATLGISGLTAVGATALHFEQVELADAAGANGSEDGNPPPPPAGG
jgi:hypothetical protein